MQLYSCLRYISYTCCYIDFMFYSSYIDIMFHDITYTCSYAAVLFKIYRIYVIS